MKTFEIQKVFKSQEKGLKSKLFQSSIIHAISIQRKDWAQETSHSPEGHAVWSQIQKNTVFPIISYKEKHFFHLQQNFGAFSRALNARTPSEHRIFSRGWGCIERIEGFDETFSCIIYTTFFHNGFNFPS